MRAEVHTRWLWESKAMQRRLQVVACGRKGRQQISFISITCRFRLVAPVQTVGPAIPPRQSKLTAPVPTLPPAPAHQFNRQSGFPSCQSPSIVSTEIQFNRHSGAHDAGSQLGLPVRPTLWLPAGQSGSCPAGRTALTVPNRSVANWQRQLNGHHRHHRAGRTEGAPVSN